MIFMGISLLVFSRNDIDNAVSLIKDMKRVVDEIVVIDSSDRKLHERLLRFAKGEKKLRVYYAVPLGFPEPLRAWAVKKCRSEWIIYLDTDERLNGRFRKDLGKIVENAKGNAFAIKRYEKVERERRKSGFFTWQIRLYKRDKIIHRGLLHEQPLVSGNLEKMDDRYYIEHRTDLMHHEVNEYGRSEIIFDRMSYSVYNENMLDYVSKVIMPKERSISNSVLGKFIRGAFSVYEGLTGKRGDDELSNFDYSVFFLIRNLALNVKSSGINGIASSFGGVRYQLGKVREWKARSDSAELFEISKIVNIDGTTRYLGLDKEKAVEKLNERYKNGEHGVELLLMLLKKRYESGQGRRMVEGDR